MSGHFADTIVESSRVPQDVESDLVGIVHDYGLLATV